MASANVGMVHEPQSLEGFLKGVERRALRMAEIATGNREDALDLVQEAMLALAKRYGSRQADEWSPLFFRILQNGIRDWHRRARVRNVWRQWRSRTAEDDDANGLETQPADPAGRPEESLMVSQAGARLLAELQHLPYRQQQAFLLRAWQGLDVTQTAKAMGCSQGSVKTHYSRAVHRLRDALEGYWP